MKPVDDNLRSVVAILVFFSLTIGTLSCSIEEFFASEPKIMEIFDEETGVSFKGLAGEMRLGEGVENDGKRVKREAPTSTESPNPTESTEPTEAAQPAEVPFYLGTVWSFFNIPYAESLTSDTVFDMPVALTPERYKEYMKKRDGKDETMMRQYGNFCPQPAGDENELYEKYCKNTMDIDCLTLNIFSPPMSDDNTNLSVYVLLHGGRFARGSSCDFERLGLLTNFIRENVIVVTVNYRIGLYGFYNLNGTETNHSLRGFYDIKVALEFVREHIHKFHGNKDDVTLGGFDSGACAANMLALASFVDPDYVQERRNVPFSGPGRDG
ncbi:carboxylesterase family domain-containing protein [Ditylenchus destructor]|uniref:Carboxylesterase family domain-containing protein n=1 Tax=Ditylenchus destructor TaxID=166010 RepID=A0AAD4QWH6_9BILA|nr:carboxylesterase family domain-containing protein [Ditylenchus destructor]